MTKKDCIKCKDAITKPDEKPCSDCPDFRHWTPAKPEKDWDKVEDQCLLESVRNALAPRKLEPSGTTEPVTDRNGLSLDDDKYCCAMPNDRNITAAKEWLKTQGVIKAPYDLYKYLSDYAVHISEIMEREAMKTAWIESRRHYVGYNDTIKIAVGLSFDKWYNEWKEATK